MENKYKCCKECSCNIDLVFEIVSCKCWCKHLNIPLINPEKTLCDNFKQKRRGGNPWNFRKVEGNK